MLELMRRFASTWIGRALGVLLLVGLAGFGIQNVLLDLGSNTLATVGGQDITTQQFQRAYQQQLNNFAQQTGQMPTGQQAIQLGIPTAVISKLASDAAVNQLALQQGIGLSDAQLGKMVREDPSFFGALGTFEKANFDQVLRQNGYTEAEYFDLQTQAGRRQQIALGLFAGTAVPKTAEELLNRYRNDTRSVSYFTIGAANIPPVAVPTDDDLKKYLADHQAQFRTKETRTIDVMALSVDVLATLPEYQPTEDEIKAEYDRTKDSLTTAEKRDIQQVVLSDASKEQFFTPGVSFADALKASGLTATDIGLLSRAEVQDPALADAAFGLAKEGDFVLIPGIGGKRVVAVTKIEPGGVVPYEQAKPDIAKRLATTKAKNAYADVQDQVEELRAAFKPLKEIADRFKLPMQTVAITASGSELSAYPQIAEADRAKVATGVFAATAGKLAPTVAITATNNVYFDLSKVDEARDETLDEVKDALTKAWTDAKIADAKAASAKAAVDELNSGTSIELVASEYNSDSKTSPQITRDGQKDSPVLNQQVATQIFSSGDGSNGSAIDGDGDYVIYHVLDTTAATNDPGKNIADFLANSQRDGLYQQFVNGLRDEAGIHINQQALAGLLNLDQPAQ